MTRLLATSWRGIEYWAERIRRVAKAFLEVYGGVLIVLNCLLAEEVAPFTEVSLIIQSMSLIAIPQCDSVARDMNT